MQPLLSREDVDSAAAAASSHHHHGDCTVIQPARSPLIDDKALSTVCPRWLSACIPLLIYIYIIKSNVVIFLY